MNFALYPFASIDKTNRVALETARHFGRIEPDVANSPTAEKMADALLAAIAVVIHPATEPRVRVAARNNAVALARMIHREASVAGIRAGMRRQEAAS